MKDSLPAQDIPVSITARELHRLLKKSHRLGNRLRLRFSRALLAVHDTRH